MRVLGAMLVIMVVIYTQTHTLNGKRVRLEQGSCTENCRMVYGKLTGFSTFCCLLSHSSFLVFPLGVCYNSVFVWGRQHCGTCRDGHDNICSSEDVPHPFITQLRTIMSLCLCLYLCFSVWLFLFPLIVSSISCSRSVCESKAGLQAADLPVRLKVAPRSKVIF